MFLRRSLASLARAYTLHVGIHLGPPPHTIKLATLLLPAFAHQKSGQIKLLPPPPPPPLATRNRRHWLYVMYVESVCQIEDQVRRNSSDQS